MTEVLGSLKCDCSEQLNLALKRLQAQPPGIVLYLQQVIRHPLPPAARTCTLHDCERKLCFARVHGLAIDLHLLAARLRAKYAACGGSPAMAVCAKCLGEPVSRPCCRLVVLGLPSKQQQQRKT